MGSGFRDDVKHWVQSPDAFTKRHVIVSGIGNSPLRGFVWFVYMHLMDPDPEQWPTALKKMHESYTQMKAKVQEWRESGIPEEAVEEINPFTGQKAPIDLKYSFKRTFKIVNLDIDRMLHGTSFYKQPWIREMILNILDVYFLYNGQDYSQGMHEMTALAIRTLYETQAGTKAEFENYSQQDSSTEGSRGRRASIPDSSPFAIANSNESDPDVGIAIPRDCVKEFDLESCAYFMTEAILKELNSLYDTDAIKEVRIEIMDTMKNAKKDPMITEIYNKIMEYKLQPELFLVRWLRLGFTREFSHKRSQLLWDIMFAHSYLTGTGLFSLNVSFCIELLRVRYYRIVNSQDFTTFIQTLLLPYSEALDSDVISILHSAITIDALRNEKTEKYLKDTRINRQYLGRNATLLTENPDKKTVKLASMMNKTKLSDLKIAEEEALQKIVCDKLDEMLDSIQESIKQTNNVPEARLYKAVSELKSLRDVCLYINEDNNELLEKAVQLIVPNVTREKFKDKKEMTGISSNGFAPEITRHKGGFETIVELMKNEYTELESTKTELSKIEAECKRLEEQLYGKNNEDDNKNRTPETSEEEVAENKILDINKPPIQLDIDKNKEDGTEEESEEKEENKSTEIPIQPVVEQEGQ